MPDAKNFSVYEFGGILAPGALTLLIIGQAAPALDLTPSLSKYSFGGALIFLIVAYVAGQLLQAVGNWLEWLIWKLYRGWPTDWPRSGAHHMLAKPQSELLASAVRRRFSVDDVSRLSEQDWRSITRQLYSVVQERGNADRIDRFNATYGLLRGVGSATLVTAIVVASTSWPSHLATAALLGAGFIARLWANDSVWSVLRARVVY
jgi:hypothetical protein